MTTITTEAPHYCGITVYKGETWYDPIPQFVDVVGTAYPLTGKTLQLFMRPTYDYEDPIEILTSVGSDGILFEDAANGLAAFFMEEANVANLPVGVWEQFLRLGFTDGLLGDVKKIVWRGPLRILPGKTTA